MASDKLLIQFRHNNTDEIKILFISSLMTFEFTSNNPEDYLRIEYDDDYIEFSPNTTAGAVGFIWVKNESIIFHTVAALTKDKDYISSIYIDKSYIKDFRNALNAWIKYRKDKLK